MSAFPNKYVPVTHSPVGVASFVADNLFVNDTISTLWERVRKDERVRTFDRYAEALTLLYAAGLVTVEHGVLRLTQPERSAQ